jgi:hypothetical protein
MSEAGFGPAWSMPSYRIETTEKGGATARSSPHVLQLEPSTARGHSDFCFQIYFFVSSPSPYEFEAEKRSVILHAVRMRHGTEEASTVKNDVEVFRLINFETATDGTAVRLLVEDIAGRTIGIVLTIETLSALLMTLPRMASDAVKRAHNDSAMRITYPATNFQIELSEGNVRILTIGTPDGFTVSISLTEEFSQDLGEAHLKGIGQRAKMH